MAIVLTGTKTITRAIAPHLTAAELTALLAIAPENLTVAQLDQLSDAAERVSGGSNPAATLGSLFA